MTSLRKTVLSATIALVLGAAGFARAAGPTETVQTAIQRVFTGSSAPQAKAGSTDDRRAHIREAGVDASVSSRLVTAKGSQVDVGYRLYRAGDRWAVYDVSVDGVSLVDNYKMQFSRLIQRSSFAELLKTLREKAGS